MKNHLLRGFTLVELIIVVAVVGVLAAIAIPQYKAYVTKSRINSAMSSVEGIKISTAMCILDSGGLTNCNSGSRGVPSWTATNVVASVVVSDAEIVLTFTDASKVGPELGGKTVTLTPTQQASQVLWTATTDVAAGPIREMILKYSTH